MDRTLNLTETQAYLDLVEAYLPGIPEGAFTVRKFASDSGMTLATARRRLDALVEAGTLNKKLVVLDRCRRMVYWFPQP